MRNKELIDLSHTPENLRKQIIEEFHAQSSKDRSQLFNYFMKNRMRILMEHINEF